MTTEVRQLARSYQQTRNAIQNRTGSKAQLAIPQLELSAHEKLVSKAAYHYLETQLLSPTGQGTLLSIEQTEELDEWWISSVFQMVRAIRFEADTRPAS